VAPRCQVAVDNVAWFLSDVLGRERGWCAQACADAPERVGKVAVGVGIGTKLNAPSSSWALCRRSTA
jgi:hypothetical protein